jgi:hypothetical protein
LFLFRPRVLGRQKFLTDYDYQNVLERALLGEVKGFRLDGTEFWWSYQHGGGTQWGPSVEDIVYASTVFHDAEGSYSETKFTGQIAAFPDSCMIDRVNQSLIRSRKRR